MVRFYIPRVHVSKPKFSKWPDCYCKEKAYVKRGNDYFTGGMLLPNRIYQASGSDSSNYRYGFNGMKRDDDWNGAGNSYAFGARMYDARLNKFLSIDRYYRSLPSISHSSFAQNWNVIYRDHNGDFVVVATIAGIGIYEIIITVTAATTTYTISNWRELGRTIRPTNH